MEEEAERPLCKCVLSSGFVWVFFGGNGTLECGIMCVSASVSVSCVFSQALFLLSVLFY